MIVDNHVLKHFKFDCMIVADDEGEIKQKITVLTQRQHHPYTIWRAPLHK